MNSALIALELRKNALAAASVVAAFLITLPVAFLVAATTGMPAARALESILTGWIILGLPFAAVLIGASAGAQAAARESHEAEALFPVSARRRIAASLTAAVLLSAAIVCVVLAVSLLCGPTLSVLHPERHSSWGGTYWDQISRARSLALFILDALAASWTLAYIFGHGIGGGFLGFLLSALTLSALLASFLLEFLYAGSGWAVSFSYGWILPLMALSVASKALAAARAASWRERRPRLGVAGAALLAGALLTGPAAAWTLVGHAMISLRRQTRLVGSRFSMQYPWIAEADPKSVAAAGREAALMDFGSGLVIVGAGGARSAVPDDRANPIEMLFHPSGVGNVFWNLNVQRDERGRLWVHRDLGETSELWREEPDGTMASRRDPRFPDIELEKIGRRVVIKTFDPTYAAYFDVDEFFRRGRRASGQNLENLLRRERREEKAAEVGCGGLCLRYGGRTWRLPGKALADRVFPYRVGGRPVYLVPVRLIDGAAMVLCRENGKVDFAWRLTRSGGGGLEWDSRFYALPDGTLFNYGPENTIGLVDVSGKAAAFISFARLRRDHPDFKNWRPTPVRRNAGGIELYWEGRLFSLDKSGAVLADRPMPKGEAYPLRDGFLVVARSRVYFAGWDGTTRASPLP